jgi:putative aldouronate transport system substrate-binding protein
MAIAGLVYNEQELEVINEFHQTILSYVQESFARFVTGDLSVDSDWNTYLTEFEKMNLKGVISAAQAAYDRQKK